MPFHVVQRGHHRSAVFFEDFDYLNYLACLREAAQNYGCSIHAYVLMTNHVHLLLTPAGQNAIGRLFQSIARHYVPYFNRKYGRQGTLWEGRHKSSMIDSATYLLSCMRYIEMNPVRAGMVAHPAEYRWSSYAANALAVSNVLVSPREEFLELGSDLQGRCDAYRAYVSAGETPEAVDALRATLQTGTPLGNDKFRREIEAALGVKVGHCVRGRPRKTPLIDASKTRRSRSL
jgi:putative transposase